MGVATMVAWAGSARPEDAGRADPPVLRLVQPLGVEPGEEARLTIRGQRLGTNGTVSAEGLKDVRVEWVGQGDAPGINGFDAARVGDRKVEVKLTVPAGVAPGTNVALVFRGTNGVSAPFRLMVVRKGLLAGEKEPNDGFRDAPGAPVPVVLRGGFATKGDVDVFRVNLPEGRRLRAEVMAERLGSTLDATCAVYDAGKALVASVDDTAGRDPVVEFEAKRGGDYFVVVGYVNDQAAPTHEYLLFLTQP
jgi:hypothetical protein